MKLIKYVWILLAFGCLAVSAKNKNVLFIAVDDLKPLLNCYGDDFAVTPNIDKLAEAGTVFQNAHCQQAVCGPSRVSLLTGYYPDTTGIYGMGGGKYKLREMHPDILTLPQHFKNNGYATIGTGKIFDPRNVEDDWHGPQDAISWTKFFGKNPYNAQTGGPKAGHYHDPEVLAMAKLVEAEGKAKGLKGKPLRNYMRDRGAGPAVECYDVPDDAYKDGGVANRGVEQLERSKDSGQSFFLAVGFLKPHLPFVAPKKYWDLYQRHEIEQPKNYNQIPKGAPKISISNSGELRSYNGIPKKGPVSDSLAISLIHGYYATISYTDALIGKILSALKNEGLDMNTIVIFVSDHGYMLQEHTQWAKFTNYNTATQVPLIIYDPRTETKGSTNALVSLIDIYPTLAELCGLEPPKNQLDGKSLVSIFKNPNSKGKEHVFIKRRNGFTLKTMEYSYTEFINAKSNLIVDKMLYDHRLNKAENINLADSEEFSKIVSDLSSVLHSKFKENVYGK